MDQAGFPWRQLGTLLVDEGLLNQSQLEFALTEQRRTGRLLGQILVDFGYVSGFSLARALAAQHGVELRPTKETPPPDLARDEQEERQEDQSVRENVRWRPLGKLLVESGLVTRADLEVAIMEQRRSGGRLGEILVQRGCLSGPELARALAAQHGVDLGSKTTEDDDFETVITPTTSSESLYQVWEVVLDPSYRATSVLYSSANFLDAADFAFEFVEEHEPDALEIQRADGPKRETLWAYSARRAAAIAESRKDLTATFGFDPTTWDGSLQARDFTGATDF
jgi:hypothetical protein